MAYIPFLNNAYFSAKVGIGTDSPGAKLDISSSIDNLSSPSEDFRMSSSVYTPSNYYNSIYNSISGNTTSLLQFRVNSGFATQSTVMTLKGTGNVGIGTTSPSAKLHVDNSGVATTSVRFDAGAAADAIVAYGNGGKKYFQLGEVGATDPATMSLFNNEVETIRLKTNGNSFFNGGNVGIGTTSPAAKLEVYGSAPFIYITDDTETESGIIFRDIQAGMSQAAAIKFSSGDNKLRFYNNDATAERMVIDVSGNVGIGTTSPQSILNINGGTGSLSTGLTFGDGDTGIWEASDDNLRFSTTSSTRMIITSVGAIKFNAYDSTNNTGAPTYLLGTDASGNVVKTLSTPSPITSQAASLYDLIPNGAFTTTYAFTSTAGTYAEVMSGDDVITAAGTYSVQMYVSDYLVGGTQYREYYSGVMSWSAPDSTNDTGIGAVSEIVLHRAGHAANGGITYLRTRETGSTENNELRLEIMCNKTYTGASNVVFKFVRLI